MFIQQKIQPSAMDPRQARIMMMLPVIFTFFFLTFPAGLVLYWLFNNLLTILQQYVTMKLQPAPAATSSS
jgi:YidC/Oxa1 family membrane protein insertase